MSISTLIYVQNGAEENQWDYVLSNIKVDKIYMGGSYQGTNNVLRDAPHITTFDDLPNDPIVLLSPESSQNFKPNISILEFEHPESAIYVFGPNNEHLTDEDVGNRKIDYIVNIPTDTKDEMFNYSAYLITMWNRRYG